MARLRPVDFEDRLTLVEHLDELRTRIIISIAAFAVAFALCFWQNNRLLDIANAPLPGDREPITFGVAEPFTTTVTISAYAALVISLPVILYQAYAFVLPALTTREKRFVVPFLMMVPVLFIAGVVFGYFVVLPAATKFLLNFNDNQFNIQIRARDYYSFFTLTLGVDGPDLPVADRRSSRSPGSGIVTPEQLAQEPPLRVRDPHRRRRAAAGHRSGHDADRGGAADPALRGERAARPGLRQAVRRSGRAGDRGVRATAQRRGIVGHPDPLRFSALLFDLQSPRRRRVIRVTFGALAAIFAISFVFLGVGTGGGGFSFSDLFGGGSSGSTANAFDDDIKTAEQQIAVNPADTAAMARLVQLQYSAANANTDSNGAPTSEGEQHLQEAADAWNKYVKVSKGNPNPSTAVYALNTFDLLARLNFAKARNDTSTADALTDVTAAVTVEDRRAGPADPDRRSAQQGDLECLRKPRPVPLSRRRDPGRRSGGREGQAGQGE